MKTWRSIVLFTFFFYMGVAHAAKTLIFYSSIGMGHLSASRAIEEKLKQADPEAEVELKNIRDFMGPTARKIDEKLYWIVFKHFPKVFSSAYLSSMKQGLEVQELSQLKSSYSEQQALEYIRSSRAETVIATHYGSAIILGNLKQKGLIPDVKTAWVHTDYIEHYFPRISQRLDKTFVGHHELEKSWIRFGVDPSRVMTTGIPVRNIPSLNQSNRDEFLSPLNLKSDRLTFVLSGGSEGLKNYEMAILSLAKAYPDQDIQIVAICGKNEKAKQSLDKLSKTLPQNIQLRAFGFIPNAQLLGLISAADIYVTKAGGLSPTEGALMVRPMILISEFGGHESENAEFFKRTGLAEVVTSSRDLGAKTVELLKDKDKLVLMQEKQTDYRNSVNLEKLVDWIRSDKAQGQVELVTDLGLKNGREVKGTDSVITRLDRDFPSQVEIILSYPKSRTGTYLGDGKESNPFGHIALRIRDDVYTVNHLAQRGSEDKLLHKSSLKEYLYSTQQVYRNEEFTGMQGQAYAKDSISVRINGVSEQQLEAMIRKIEDIDLKWQRGDVNYVAKTCNCADLTLDVLKAGKVLSEASLIDKKVKLPLDVFDEVTRQVEKSPQVQSSMIFYSYVRDSKNEYKTAGFPLSFYQLKRAAKNYWNKGHDPVEYKINARIASPENSNEVIYERVRPVFNPLPQPVVQCRKLLLEI